MLASRNRSAPDDRDALFSQGYLSRSLSGKINLLFWLDDSDCRCTLVAILALWGDRADLGLLNLLLATFDDFERLERSEGVIRGIEPGGNLLGADEASFVWNRSVSGMRRSPGSSGFPPASQLAMARSE
jgi:hypothetical protein